MICRNEEIFLGMKKRGFGVGRWNGFGGKVKDGESIEDGARREVLEECGMRVENLEEYGVIDFEFQGNPEILEVHVFSVTEFSGEPKESEEMRPQWFAFDAIPYNMMWSDDVYWLPLLLKGKKFKAKFLFDKNDKVLKHKIQEL